MHNTLYKHNITMQTVLLASHEDPPAVVLRKTPKSYWTLHAVACDWIPQFWMVTVPYPSGSSNMRILFDPDGGIMIVWYIGTTGTLMLSEPLRGAGACNNHREKGAQGLSMLHTFWSLASLLFHLWRKAPKKLFHHGPNPLSAAQDTMPCLNRPEPLILLLICI